LGLPTAFEDQYGSGGVDGIGLAGRNYPTTSGSQLKDNPKLKLAYRRDETQNSERVIWYREDNSAGYKQEIGFLSASRLKVGERVYQNDVATKYMSRSASQNWRNLIASWSAPRRLRRNNKCNCDTLFLPVQR
jgi:hypothetical protein